MLGARLVRERHRPLHVLGRVRRTSPDETNRPPEPRVWHGRSGWLAVSAPGSVLNVGVVGESEEVAWAAFREELAA